MKALHERLIQIEEHYGMTQEQVATALRIPFDTYRGFRSGRSVRTTHWQRIALDFLLKEGPKKYAAIA